MTPTEVHFLLVGAAWGGIVSVVANFVKQDGWPKWVNTVVATALVVVTAVVHTFVSQPALTVHAFWLAFLSTWATALATHFGLLEPTGVGPAIQSATSVHSAAT